MIKTFIPLSPAYNGRTISGISVFPPTFGLVNPSLHLISTFQAAGRADSPAKLNKRRLFWRLFQAHPAEEDKEGHFDLGDREAGASVRVSAMLWTEQQLNRRAAGIGRDVHAITGTAPKSVRAVPRSVRRAVEESIGVERGGVGAKDVGGEVHRSVG